MNFKSILFIILSLFSINSFAQKDYDFPDYIILEDTVRCKVYWHSDSQINYIDKIHFRKGYLPATISKSKTKGYLILSTDVVYIDSGGKAYSKENSNLKYNTNNAGYYLKIAGNYGLATYLTTMATFVGVYLNPKNSIIISTSGGVLSGIFICSAWLNIRRAGEEISNKKLAVSVSPNSLRLVYKF